MAKTLDEFVSAIQPLLRDKTTGVVETNDVRDALNRCIRYLTEKEGIYASKNKSDLSVFPTVYSYPVPSDFSDPINIYANDGNPMNVTRKTPDGFQQVVSSQDNIMAVDTILGDNFLRLKMSSAGSSITLHNCDSLTANGTWAADTSGSDATNLTLDEVNKKEGAGALNFDADVSQSVNNFSAVSNSTLTALDLSNYSNSGTAFMWVYLPDVTYITSLTFRWGSSSSAYYSNTATTQFNGQAFRNGWNEVGFDWASASTTGSPDSTAVDYLYLRVTYSASQGDDTDFRLDFIRMDNPEITELNYYSTSFVENNAGTTQSDEFSAGDDRSLLKDTDDDVLFWWALAEAYQIKELANDRMFAEGKFKELVPAIAARYGNDRKIATRRWY